jgi:hypothetical protein
MRAPLVLLVLAAAAGSARAYPQFQLSSGASRCSTCHFSPVGGGLINAYGREEAGDTISSGGDGRFLHGVWEPPPWLALGGDFRGAALVDNVGATDSPEYEIFPMQMDLYGRVAVGPVSLSITAGARGFARPEGVPAVNYLSSREHFLMWRPSAVGPYVRVGRFFAPYGLRLPEHIDYLRRFLGFNTLEETYNVSGGMVEDDWELHVTGFVPDFILRPIGYAESGGAAYFEKRWDRRLAVGAQARVGVGDEEARFMAGAVGKYYLAHPRLMFLAEVDLVRQTFSGVSGGDRNQLQGYLGATWFLHRGWMLSGTLERFDEDLAISGVARDAVSFELQWFPFAHFETSLYGRLQIIGTGGSDGSASQVLLLQVHYYL